MATTNDPDPTGKLMLVDYFHETSSTHYDESRKIALAPGIKTNLELTEFCDECDQFKGPRTESTSKWSIERDLLIELIKEHGRRL